MTVRRSWFVYGDGDKEIIASFRGNGTPAVQPVAIYVSELSRYVFIR